MMMVKAEPIQKHRVLNLLFIIMAKLKVNE
jgi:hypothetical protein